MHSKSNQKLIRAATIAFFRLKSRYHYSLIGAMIEPLTTLLWIGAISVFFGQTRDIVYLATGVIIYRYLSEIVSNATFLKHRILNLIQNFGDRHTDIFFTSAFLENFYLFLLNLVAISPILIFFNSASEVNTLFGLLAILLTMAISGYCMFNIMFAVSIRFNNVETIVKPSLRLLFFASPIFWAYETTTSNIDVTTQIRHAVYFANPLSWLMEFSRFLLGYNNPTHAHIAGIVFIILIALRVIVTKEQTLRITNGKRETP